MLASSLSTCRYLPCLLSRAAFDSKLIMVRLYLDCVRYRVCLPESYHNHLLTNRRTVGGCQRFSFIPCGTSSPRRCFLT